LLATTTGTAAADRVEAMVKNAVYGNIVAKALGIKEPLLHIECGWRKASGKST